MSLEVSGFEAENLILFKGVLAEESFEVNFSKIYL